MTPLKLVTTNPWNNPRAPRLACLKPSHVKAQKSVLGRVFFSQVFHQPANAVRIEARASVHMATHLFTRDEYYIIYGIHISIILYIYGIHISIILYMVFTRDQSADSVTRESRPAASFSRALLDKRRGSWQRKNRCWRKWIGQNLSRPCEQRGCYD